MICEAADSFAFCLRLNHNIFLKISSSPHAHQKAPGPPPCVALPLRLAQDRTGSYPDKHTRPNPGNNTIIFQVIRSEASHNRLLSILAWSKNLRFWAARSGYFVIAWRRELIFKKWFCMMRPKGSLGQICSYKTNNDCGKSLAVQLMMSSDLENTHKHSQPILQIPNIVMDSSWW